MRVITDGTIPEELAMSKPGPVCHSRWLILVCRVLRLYVSDHSLDEGLNPKLRDIVAYIMMNYGPI